MKRGTLEHPKLRDLCTRLHLPVYSGVGLLEMLWHFTATYAPRGDVGRFSDAAIARALGWRGSPSRLVEAMVGAGWLDRGPTLGVGCPHPDPGLRLVVHDWQDHADQAVRKRLERKGLTFTVSGQRMDISGQRMDMDMPRAQASPEPVPVPEPVPEPEPESAHARSDAETAWNEFLEAYPSHTGVDAGCRWYQIQFERRPDPRAWHSEVMAGLRRHLESAKWKDPETGELDLRFVVSIPRFLGMPDSRDPTRGPMYVDRPPPWKPRSKRRRRSALEEMEGT